MKISASFLKIINEEENIKKLDKTNIDYMHYDVMDGLFTENKTPSLLNIETTKPKDIHLMVKDVYKYIDDYSKLNPKFLTVHIEVLENPIEIIEYIKNKNIKVGIALNPETSIEKIKPYLDLIDLVLVMSVKPGKGGQKFIDITNKIKELKKIQTNYLIEVDGGINNETIKLCDVDIAVVGSYITDSNYVDRINTLRGN